MGLRAFATFAVVMILVVVAGAVLEGPRTPRPVPASKPVQSEPDDPDKPIPFRAQVQIPGFGSAEVASEKDVVIDVDGKHRAVRVLCVNEMFVYALYQGRFFALNGLSMRPGTKIDGLQGRFPVSADPPMELRTHPELIERCDASE